VKLVFIFFYEETLSQSLISIPVFIIICVIVSVFAPKRLNNLVLASVIAGVGSAILFQVLGIIVMGYLDPFFIIAFMVSAPVAFVIALFVGGILNLKRRVQLQR
jgi:hypothetical protein